jgi:hypothetical protein
LPKYRAPGKYLFLLEVKMETKSTHEPRAKVMSATDVWNDARKIASVLKHNLLESEPMVRFQIPLSTFLNAVENLNREELLILQKHIETRLVS